MNPSQGKPSENQKEVFNGQITAKQHYVPKFYLKMFANPDGTIEVLDVPKRRILLPHVPKAVCYEKFNYAATTGVPDELSQQIEKIFQSMEDSLAKRVDPIITKLLSSGHVDAEEKWDIAFLMSMLWLRGPAMRQQINQLFEQISKHVTKMQFSHFGSDHLFEQYDQETWTTTTPEARERIKRMFIEGDYSLSFSNISHLEMFRELQGFANLFHAQDWLVYISRSNEKFTTSDNPITVVLPKKTRFYGPTFIERTHYFPLTPEIFIVCRFPDKRSGKKLWRKTLFSGNDSEIVGLNLITSNQVIQSAYAKERKSLEDLLATAMSPERIQTSTKGG